MMSAADAIFSATRGFMTSRGWRPFEHLQRVNTPRLDVRDLVRRERAIDEKDVADAVGPRRVDDGLFRRQQAPVAVEGDEIRVGAIGDVLDETRRQAHERAVVVHGPVEVARGEQEPAREHQVPQAAVVERERPAARLDFLGEALQPQADGRPRPSGHRFEQANHLGRERVLAGGGAAECAHERQRCPGRVRDGHPQIEQLDRARRRQLRSVAARFDAFLRKSDGPRLSPRNRRTSPVDAPSS